MVKSDEEVLSIEYVQDTIQSAVHLILTVASGTGPVLIPTVHMRLLRLREVGELDQGLRASKGWAWAFNLGPRLSGCRCQSSPILPLKTNWKVVVVP